MDKLQLYRLLFAIFIAEGDVKASVPFGWLRRKNDWRRKRVTFMQILKEVAGELMIEHERWLQACRSKGFEGDFVRWLARVGYNANPLEWDDWEQNVRKILKQLP